MNTRKPKIHRKVKETETESTEHKTYSKCPNKADNNIKRT